MPQQQQLEVSLQFDFKLSTFLDAFDVMDYTLEIKGDIAKLIQDRLIVEDDLVRVSIEDISFAAGEKVLKTTVVQYFEDRLESAWPWPVNEKDPASPSHPNFTIDTGCGADCKSAIDAAVEMLRHTRKAYGSDSPELGVVIVQSCAEIVRCYVYG